MNAWTVRPVTILGKCNLRSLNGRRLLSYGVWVNSDKSRADDKSFSKTLLLPKTSFPLWTDPTTTETKFHAHTCENLYRWQWNNAKGPLFVLHDGPPYANGNLHMGHALNKILKDIINRYHVLLGRKVHYIPGWDCHGLPIENKALQELGQDSLTVPASMIRIAAHATATREIESQKQQFRRLGIMADWSQKSTYRTLDHEYEMRQLRIFQKMVEKGLIYRHYRPVYYSPSSRSALAEAELVYKDDHVSHSVYITFEIDRRQPIKSPFIQEIISASTSVQLLVWTTTPWTLTANMGIAVNPNLTYTVVRLIGANQNEVRFAIVAKGRLEDLGNILGPGEVLGDIEGSDLVDIPYIPLFSSVSGQNKPLRVIPASHVTSESGTGLVHCAPAHGAEDYHTFRALDLISSAHSMICHVDAAGKFTPEVANIVGEIYGPKLVGQEVLDSGSKAIVVILREIGCLVKLKRIKHRYPYDWKTNEPVIVTATMQWFANLDSIKDDALDALKPVSFVPPASRNRLESFVRTRSEWCISRQRVWGVPIPALHDVATDQTVLDPASIEYILSVLEEKGVAHWWNGTVDDFVPPVLRQQGRTWRKGTETMDVWFDSGTSWSMLNEMGARTEQDQERDRIFHADLCLEGSDQHRGWFQSQLLTAIGFASTKANCVSPYGTLITHGMVLDEAGKKMSKSLGNIVSPMMIIEGGKDKKKEPAYGADVLRLWAATVEFWRDISVGPTVLAQAAESLRKLRNSARFILGNIGDAESRSRLQRVPKAEMDLVERYIMHELYNLERTAVDGYATYNFPKVMNTLTNFANITLSSLYFDITKDCLYANEVTSFKRRAVVTVLEQVLKTMTFVLAPVLPHLAEEIHQSFKSSDTSLFMSQWTLLSSDWEDNQAATEMKELLRVRGVVLSALENARRNKHIKSSLEAQVDLVVPGRASDVRNPFITLLEREENLLKTLFIVSDVVVMDEGSLGTSCPEWVYYDTLQMLGDGVDVAVRLRPAALQKCPRCWTFTRLESDMLCPRCTRVVGY